jgi:hypothetical protein
MMFPSIRSFATLVMAIFPVLACAEGLLEIPAASSYQSGIGLISGWHCSAARIEISIDLGPPILVSSHTPRDDTAPVCGRSDTGFAMTFNWNILRATGCCDIGEVNYHRVIAFADGVPFADTKFFTTKFGFASEYLAGKSGVYLLRNFPDAGNAARISWDQDKQNFSIVKSEYVSQAGYPGYGGSGTYYGAVRTRDGCTNPQKLPAFQPRHGTFTIKTDNGLLEMRADYADGGVCLLPAVALVPDRPLVDGLFKARFSGAQLAACPELGSYGMDVAVNGKVLDATFVASCSYGTITGAAVATDAVAPTR